jgi:prepilin-type N-terminal cleavage/methylation domain-containing protein
MFRAKQKTSSREGFTMIELLVVIAIIAVLAVMVILRLNPAEFLRQARDSSRLSDMSSLKNAILLYMNDSTNLSLGTTGVCYMGNAIGTSTEGCLVYFATATSTATSTSQALDGTGWVPVNFSQLSSGLPLSQLPIDPSGPNNPDLFYSYISSNNSAFKLAAFLESQVYGFGGDRDAVSADNGISTSTFESGSDISL